MKLFYNHKNQVATWSSQPQWLLTFTCIVWLVAKIIGWKIWMTERSFPGVSPFAYLDKVPPTIHVILFLLSIVLLIALIFKPGNRVFQTILFFSDL